MNTNWSKLRTRLAKLESVCAAATKREEVEILLDDCARELDDAPATEDGLGGLEERVKNSLLVGLLERCRNEVLIGNGDHQQLVLDINIAIDALATPDKGTGER